MNQIKKHIYNKIVELLDSKIKTLSEIKILTQESRNNDTKSSAGDKFETGREMMQIEMDKIATQLSKTAELKGELLKIDLKEEYNTVQFGSIVITNNENYFMCISVGKIQADEENYYAISLASPLGRVLYNKTIGDKVKFKNREFIVEDVF